MNILALSNGAVFGAGAQEASSLDASGLIAQSTSFAAAEQVVEISRQYMESAAEVFSDYVRASDKAISFEAISTSAGFVIRVSDPNTGQVIRQVPSDEVIRLMKYFETNRSVAVDTFA